MDHKLLITPAEAVSVLGIGRSRTYAMVAAGTLPSIRIGRSVRIPAEDLRGWIESMKDKTNGPSSR